MTDSKTAERKKLSADFRIHKKRDGLMVLRQSDHRGDFLDFFEGVAFRLGFGLPRRILNWFSPDGSVQVRQTPGAQP